MSLFEKTTIVKTVTVKDENLNESTQEELIPLVTMVRDYSKNTELAAQNETEESEVPTNVLQTGTDSEKNEDIQVESFGDEIRNDVMIEVTAKTDVSTPVSSHTRDESDNLSNKRNFDKVISGEDDESRKSSFEEKCLNQVIIPEGKEGKSPSESNIQEILSSEHISIIDAVVLNSDPIPPTTNNKQEGGIGDQVDELNHNFTTPKPGITTKPQKSERSLTDSVFDKVTGVMYAVLNSSQKEKRMEEQVSILNNGVCEDKDEPKEDKRIGEEQGVVDINVSQPSKVDNLDKKGTDSTHKAGEEKKFYQDKLEQDRGKQRRLSRNDENCSAASEAVEIRMDHHGSTASDTQLEVTVEVERNVDERNRQNQMTQKSNKIEDNGNKDANTHRVKQSVEQRITRSMRKSTQYSKVADEKDINLDQVNMERSVEQRITRSMRRSTNSLKEADEDMVGLNNTDRKQQLAAEKRPAKNILTPLQAEESNKRRRTRSCTKQTFSKSDNEGIKRQCKLMKRKKPVRFEEPNSSKLENQPKSASGPRQIKVDFKNAIIIQSGTETTSSSQVQRNLRSERNSRQKDGLFNREDEPVTPDGKNYTRVRLL